MISNAPLIMIASFYQHNAGTAEKQARHIEYIATRPGADRGETHKDLEPEDLRIRAHVGYLSDRPGSDGLFAYRDITDYKEIQKELVAHSGLSWRLVISLRADDAAKMNYDNREKWEEMVRSQIHSAGEKMGISRENLRWCAAMHTHPENVNCHVHLVVWEKDPTRTTGKLSKQELKDVKKVFGQEIFREERLKQMQEKSLARDHVRDHAAGSITKAKQLLRDLRQQGREAELEFGAAGVAGPAGLPPMLTKEKALAKMLHSLELAMPRTGRAALQFQPPEVKQMAKNVAGWIMKQPHMHDQVKRHAAAAEQLAAVYVRDPEKLKEARERAYNDIRDRVANILLRAARENAKEARRETLGAARTAKTCWRAVWQAIKHERMKAEAQAELQKLKELRKLKRKRYQDYETGKERAF
jgi:hypothetical protein